ncbi:MAG TPA: hypothetical protein VHC69_32290 [Polyangiaceae bacterium]|nr:hypothetical protein [Polyangiaceae bacterium]
MAGLFAVTAAVFVGCGGRIEADYADGGAEDTSKCGNGKIDDGEECDGTHLGGATCSSVTMNAHPDGQLSCDDKCHLVLIGCMGSGEPSTGGATGTGGRAGTGGAFGTGGGFGTGGRLGTGGVMGGNGGSTATACTSSADCRNREVCCGVRTNGVYAFTCAATCARTDTTAECKTNADCGRGQSCCGTTNQTGTTYTSISCAATCNGNGERPLCSSNTECPSGTTCGASRVLPSDFKLCL